MSSSLFNLTTFPEEALLHLPHIFTSSWDEIQDWPNLPPVACMELPHGGSSRRVVFFSFSHFKGIILAIVLHHNIQCYAKKKYGPTVTLIPVVQMAP